MNANQRKLRKNSIFKFILIISVIIILVDRSKTDISIIKPHQINDFLKYNSISNYCPLVECPNKFDTDNLNECAESFGFYDDHSKEIKFIKCQDRNKKCIFTQNALLEDGNISAECQEVIIKNNKSLPGEVCIKDSNCKDVIWYSVNIDTKEEEKNEKGQCNTSSYTCFGSKEDVTCSSHESCSVGYFCKKINDDISKCKKQLTVGEVCNSSYECLNDHFCNNNLCIKAFSLKIGETIKIDSSKESDSYLPYYCASNNINDNNTCVEIVYDSQKHEISNEVINCEKGSMCNYLQKNSDDSNDDILYSRECKCSYQHSGIGVCPYAMNDDALKSRFNSIIEMKKSGLNNNKHSLNRFKDTSSNYSNSIDCINTIYTDSIYNKASTCVFAAMNLEECNYFNDISGCYFNMRFSMYLIFYFVLVTMISDLLL